MRKSWKTQEIPTWPCYNLQWDMWWSAAAAVMSLAIAHARQTADRRQSFGAGAVATTIKGHAITPPHPPHALFSLSASWVAIEPGWVTKPVSDISEPTWLMWPWWLKILLKTTIKGHAVTPPPPHASIHYFSPSCIASWHFATPCESLADLVTTCAISHFGCFSPIVKL